MIPASIRLATAGRALALAIILCLAHGGSRPALAASSTPDQQPVPKVDAANIVFVGIVVTKFRWHADLNSWLNSRDLLAAAMQTWLGVKKERCLLLTNPSAADVKHLLTKQLPAVLKPNDTVVFYLGTHHLKNGKILMRRGKPIRSDTLALWLKPIPQPMLFLADVCYAEQLEKNMGGVRRRTRLYAARGKQKAPDIDLTGRYRAMKRFFKDTDSAIRSDLGIRTERVSLMGILVTQALTQELRQHGAEMQLGRVAKRAVDEGSRLRRTTKSRRLPDLVLVNPQPGALGLRRREATVAARTKEDAGETGGKKALDEIRDAVAAPDAAPDMGRMSILIGKVFDESVDTDAYLKRLDDMAGKIRRRIGDAQNRKDVIAALNTYLYRQIKLEAVLEPYPQDFLLTRLMDSRKGRCSALVSLYIALGERLDLPIASACVPEHTYVIWHDPGTGEKALNVETTMAGRLLPDTHYRKMSAHIKTSGAKSFYLRPLSKRESVALMLSPLGSLLRDEKRLDESIAVCKLALKINGNDAEAWNNLGMSYRQKGWNDLAAASYRQALKIHPQFAEAWNNFAAEKDTVAARMKCYQKAVLYKPDLGEAWKNLAYAHLDNGTNDLALISANQCRKLGYPLPPDLVKRLNAIGRD